MPPFALPIRKYRGLILGILLSSFNGFLHAQTNPQATHWEVLGSITTQLRFYGVDGIADRRQPFIFTTSGAPRIKHGAFSMPILFTVGTLKGTGRQPFNKLSLMPTYKSLKGYIGHNRVNFSPYTLQGRLFLGAGLEFNPGKFRFGAVYGRFNKAVEDESTDLSEFAPNYSRYGYAVKIGVGGKNNFVDLIALKAEDQAASAPSASTLPQQNTVISLSTKQRITKYAAFTGEIASSGYTRNTNSQEVEIEEIDKYPIIRQIFNPKYASSISIALSARLDLTIKSVQISGGYERIDPEYRSFMAYFFTNDVERITASIRWPMFGSKMQVYLKGGLEHNNILSTKFAQSNRVVAMLNVNYVPNQKLMFSANYSSFSINQQIIRDVYTDSIKLAQLNQNATFMAIYNVSSESFKHSISLNTGYQVLNDNGEANTGSGDFSNANANVSYAITLLKSDLTFKAGLLINQFSYAVQNSTQTRYGFTADAAKALKNNTLALGVNLAWYTTSNQTEVLYNLLVTGVYGRYAVNKHHSFALNAYLNKKTGVQSTQVSFSEWQGLVNYRYTF